MSKELTEEEVFGNDEDPIEALAAIRREEGASDEAIEELQNSSLGSSDSDSTGEEENTAEELTIDDTENTDENQEHTDDTSDKEDTTDETTEDVEGTDEETDTDKAEVSDIQRFKANGQEFEFTQDEINKQFETVFGKAMNYTQKMQQIAPYRKMISALETEGITQEALNVAIDALKGDPGALKTLIETAEVDPYELVNPDEDMTYNPGDYGKSNQTLDIEDVTGTIQNDKEFAITADVIDNQWDQQSRNAFAENPQLIAGLHSDIKTGVFDKVAPVAMKMKLYDGSAKSDLEYYIHAGQELFKEEQNSAEKAKKTVDDLNKETQDITSEFDKASSEAKRKRSARSTKKRQDRQGVVDYLNDDDEAFETWYKETMSKV